MKRPNAHLLIYMRGMKSVDLVAIVDFLYCGEANVFQENLDSFLAIAEELQLKGLMKVDEKVDNFSVNEEPVIDTNSKISKTQLRGHTSSSSRTPKTEENRAVAIPVNSSVDLDNLEERVRSMMGKSQNDYANGLRKADLCKVCGKEGMGSAIKDHIEANHLEGIVIPCNVCDKTFRSRNSLRHHRQKCIFD